MKTQIAVENGYRCIHVFDWDDECKIISMLTGSKSKVHARKRTLRAISTGEANEFLTEHHLQGKVNGQQYCIALLQEEEIIQVMTFGRLRYAKKYDVELLRLCTHSRYNVVGGAERLFKKALKDNPEWHSIISYCDLAKFTGQVYNRLGMQLERTTPPQEVWSRGTDKVTAALLRQRGYDQLFGTSHGKGTSNEQLMIEDGWLPVYDCGQAVYVWRN